tara:strand:- start:421 stop:879 length:459 start_codon:yes stop_codon:yes gene_type:complete
MTMKLELKNIKHTAWASEETHCYQASLYVDGKPVATVSNDGHGGADRYYDHPKCVYSGRSAWCDKMQEVHEYFKSLPNTHGMEQCLEFWCADQVNDWLSARELKKNLKKSYVYHFADGAGMFAHKLRPASTVAVVLNDMPFADALAIWKETA